MNNMIQINKEALIERFMRYVQIDTQSDPESNSFPTTEKQKDLSKMLEAELKAMGLSNVEDMCMQRYPAIAINKIFLPFVFVAMWILHQIVVAQM
jgi:hypothetical protein